MTTPQPAELSRQLRTEDSRHREAAGVTGAKATPDAVQAAKLTRDQWTGHRKFCGWWLLAAGFTFGALAAALPEARAALRTVRAR